MVLISLCLLISTVYNVDCSDGNTCNEGETCCYSKRGQSGCCGYERAVCCNDGVHCCPENTTCDLVQLRCVRSGYPTFLAREVDFPKRIRLNEKPVVTITPQQQVDLLEGFLEGSGLRQYIPDITDCASNSTAVINSFTNAASHFLKPNLTVDDIAQGVIEFGLATQEVANLIRSCGNITNSIYVIANYTQRILNDPQGWLSQVSSNAVKNSMYIVMDFYNVQTYLNSGNYRLAGNYLGQIIKYIFQVDVTMNLVTLFKTGQSNLNIDIPAILKCASTVYDVAQRAVPVLTDLYNNPQNLTNDLFTLYGYYVEVQSSCSGVFNTTILESAFNKYTTFLATPNLKSSLPSVTDIVACVKSIKPFATDIYEAVVAYKNQDYEKAFNILEQVVVDGANFGTTCYKLFQ